MVEIREARHEDQTAIRRVHEQAFGRPGEADLVARLHEANKVTVSLVSAGEGQITGHILFSPVSVACAGPSFTAAGMGPVAVLPEHQGRGTGSDLIRRGLAECRAAGLDLVVVLGEPQFYQRFGFARASDHGLDNEYGVDEHFMVLELAEGALAKASGLVRYSAEFAASGC